MDFSRVFDDFLISSGRTVLSISRGIILIPIITRLIGTESYGEWAAIIAFVTTVVGIGNLHLKGALIRYTPNEETDGETISQLLLISSGLVFVISVIILVTQQFVYIIPTSDINGRLTIAVISLISVDIFASVVYNYPRSKRKVKSYELIQVMKLIIEIIVLSLILYLFRDLTITIWTLSLTRLFIILFVLIYYRPIVIMPINFIKIKKYLQYSIPMVPKEIGSKFLTNADKYLLLYLASPAAAGIYAVAYSGSLILYSLTSALNPTLYPNVVQAWEEESYTDLQELYHEIYKWYSLIGVPACFGLILLSWPILRLLSTSEIAQNGWPVFSILVITFFIRGYENPITYVLHAAERNELVALINVFAAALNIGLNILFIPIYGLYGAVFATVTANTAITVYLYIKVSEIIDINLPIGTIGKALTSSMIMAILIYVTMHDINWWQKLLIYPIVGLVTYSVLIYSIGGLSSEDVTQIVNIVKL